MDTDAAAALARRIVALFAEGPLQDAATADCLASTLGPLSPGRLAARLADGDDLEAAPLRELLLFPGRDTALALEPDLAAAGLTHDDLAPLAERLAATIRHLRVRLPDTPAFALAVRPGEIARFLERLRPQHTPPRTIAQALAARFPAPLALELAVDCRQAALLWTPPRRAFLESLLARLDPTAPDAPDLVRFSLRFFAELAPDAPPLAALPRRREALVSQYHRARVQEQSLAGSNFETLLLTGARLPHLHAPDIARDLALADGVLLALTGRAGGADAPTERDLGDVDDLPGLLAALTGLDGGP